MIEDFLEIIPTYLTLLATVCGGVTAALVAGLAIWTFRDIRSRSRDFLAQVLATLLVLAVPVIGLIVYLMLRPHETIAEAYERSLEQEALLQAIEEPEVCPGCGQRVRHDFLYCPACQTHLRQACLSCGRPLHMRWELCPFCGAETPPQQPAPVATVASVPEPEGAPPE